MPENKIQNQGREQETDYKGTGGTGQVANQWDKETGGGQNQQSQDTQRGNTGGGSQKGDQKGDQQGTTKKDVGNQRERQDEQRDKDVERGTEQREENEEEEVL